MSLSLGITVETHYCFEVGSMVMASFRFLWAFIAKPYMGLEKTAPYFFFLKTTYIFSENSDLILIIKLKQFASSCDLLYIRIGHGKKTRTRGYPSESVPTLTGNT